MFLRLFFSFILCGCFCAPVQAQGQRVLLLLSYEPLYPTATPLIQYTQQALRAEFAEPVELSVEYMAADLGASPAYLQTYAQLLAEKQQSKPYNAVIAIGDMALAFAVQHQHDLFAQLPIIFINARDQHATQNLAEQGAISGVMNIPPVYELLDLLHHLYPKATELHLIDDGLPHRRALYDLVVRASEARHFTPITHSLTQRTWQELGAELAQLHHQPIILISAFTDRTNHRLLNADSNAFLNQHAASPIWHLWTAGIGQGLAGGVVSDLQKSTAIAIKMLYEKLNNPNFKEEINWQPPLITLIDEQEMQRFGFTRKDFPRDVTYLNPKSSLIRDYSVNLLIIIAVLIVFILFMIWSLLEMQRRHKADTKLKERTELIKSLLNSIPDLIFYKNASGKYLFSNNQFSHFARRNPTGFTDHDIFDKNLADFFRQKDQEACAKTGTTINEEWVKMPDDREVLLETRKTPIFNRDGTLLGVFGLSRDITELKSTQNKLEYHAHHDALTSLPNRILLNKKLEYAISLAKRNNEKLAIIYVDLDRFKDVNDSIGHDVGDLLLQEASKRLSNNLRESDICSRLGGDEFILVLNNIKDEQVIEQKCAQLLHNIAEPYQIQGHLIRIYCSLGVSVFPNDGDHAIELIRNADSALHKAKELGRNQSQRYHPSLSEHLHTRLRLEQDLQKSLARDQFSLVYQAQFQAQGKPLKAEALLRWHHPQEGYIDPLVFIPLAETSGLIAELGLWVIEKACMQFLTWRDAGLNLERICVNVSPVQINGQFAEQVQALLSRINFSAHHLELDITETTAMSNVEEIQKQLLKLKNLGISLAIDDFGAGMSSLQRLKNLPINLIKIDSSFIQKIDHQHSDLALVKALLQLANALQLEVVAEGVETLAQHQVLNDIGCHWQQGFYLAHPLSSLLFLQRFLPVAH